MGLLGILVGLGLLIWLAFRGWSVLLLAPAAALVAAAFGGEPLLANWTQVFMGSAARFLAQFFPIFLLGAIFGKLMEDSRSVSAVANFMTKKLGERRASASLPRSSCLAAACGGSGAPRRQRAAPATETSVTIDTAADDEMVRERATTAREFDPAEIHHGHQSDSAPPALLAALPLVIVVAVNLLISLIALPRLDFSFLAEERWGATSISAVAGVWSVVIALAAAIVTVILCNRGRLPALRQSMDAGANASVLPALSVASLVGFGAVIAALPAFAVVRDWVLGIQGGPLVSLAVATNVLAALTGSASGGLTVALDALGQPYMTIAAQTGLSPALMHHVAVIGSAISCRITAQS